MQRFVRNVSRRWLVSSRVVLPSSSRGGLVHEATGSSESASGSKICARSLTSFRGRLSLVNDRNTSVLPVSVLTGPAILTRCEFLCKLEVSFRVNRRYHFHWLIKTSFGPAYEAGIDASEGFRNPIPPYYCYCCDAFRLRFTGRVYITREF
jgi:hypothetical protein